MAIMPDKISLELHNTIFGTLMKDLSMEAWGFIILTNRKKLRNLHIIFGLMETTSDSVMCMKYSIIDSVDSYAKVMQELDYVATRMVFQHYGVEK
ncbi:hypothetical protein ACFX2C_027027 [Malus domestica]